LEYWQHSGRLTELFFERLKKLRLEKRYRNENDNAVVVQRPIDEIGCRMRAAMGRVNRWVVVGKKQEVSSSFVGSKAAFIESKDDGG
jgi:hypothetical protein